MINQIFVIIGAGILLVWSVWIVAIMFFAEFNPTIYGWFNETGSLGPNLYWSIASVMRIIGYSWPVISVLTITALVLGLVFAYLKRRG